MNLIRTTNPSEFISWWKEIANGIYPEAALKIKAQESLNEDFFHVGFAITQNEKISGVAALFNNPNLQYESLNAACIGKFECVNEFSVAKKLLDEIITESKTLRKEFLVGPMDGSTWDTYRYPVFSPNPLILTENIYRDYYSTFFLEAGFKTIGKYFTQLDHVLFIDKNKDERTKKFLEPLSLKYRNIDLSGYEDELKKIFSFCMETFRNNFLFTPVPEKSFVEKYLKVKTLIDPRYVIIAEHKNKIAGIIFCIPEIFHPAQKHIIIKTLAKLPEKKYAGLGSELIVRIYEEAKKNKIQGIYHAFMHETNASKVLSENFSGEKWREYILLGRKL